MVHGGGGANMRKLSDTKLRSLKPSGKAYQRADGGGMYVEVLPSGTISFRYGYRLFGRKEKVVLGTYPALSLARARQKHRDYQTMVELGESPARHHQHQKASRKAEYQQSNTFESFANRWLADWSAGKSLRAVKQAEAWLKADVFPHLGRRPVGLIEEADLMEVLDGVKRRGAPQTARRLLSHFKAILKYAKRRGSLRYNPARDITADSIAPKSERERALEPQEIARFLNALDRAGNAEQNRIALRLILLTLCRKDELRLAKWENVNLDSGEWLIPRTKGGKPHVVYLSTQAVQMFRRLRELARDSPYVLPHRDRQTKPIGHMTLNKVIDGLLAEDLKDTPRFTVHDLRRTASTRLHEAGFAPDVVEKALAHRIRGVRGVYNKAEYADDRRKMLQFWAEYVEGLVSGAQVTLIRRAA